MGHGRIFHQKIKTAVCPNCIIIDLPGYNISLTPVFQYYPSLLRLLSLICHLASYKNRVRLNFNIQSCYPDQLYVQVNNLFYYYFVFIYIRLLQNCSALHHYVLAFAAHRPSQRLLLTNRSLYQDSQSPMAYHNQIHLMGLNVIQ